MDQLEEESTKQHQELQCDINRLQMTIDKLKNMDPFSFHIIYQNSMKFCSKICLSRYMYNSILEPILMFGIQFKTQCKRTHSSRRSVNKGHMYWHNLRAYVQALLKFGYIPPALDLKTMYRGQKHIKVSQFWQIKVPYQSPFLVQLKTSLKYEYLYDTENNIFFHFQFQIMML